MAAPGCVTFDRLLLSAIDDCGYPSSGNLDKFWRKHATPPHVSLDEICRRTGAGARKTRASPTAPPEDSSTR
jgi:hypothetical protein